MKSEKGAKDNRGEQKEKEKKGYLKKINREKMSVEEVRITASMRMRRVLTDMLVLRVV